MDVEVGWRENAVTREMTYRWFNYGNLNYEDRVEVQKLSSYRGKYTGDFGTIKRFSGNTIGVALDNKQNNNSQYGLFWFKKEDLKKVSKYENKSTKENNREEYFMDKNYHPVIINFISGSNTDVTYTYAAYEDYAEGDYVVGHTGHHGMAIARVKAMGTEDDKVEYGREIICKIDMTAYNDRKARAKRKAEIKSKMEAKVKELQETAIFEMLAKEDAGLAEMLKEFKELG